MAGRPKVIIDWEKVDAYLKAQCDSTAIASSLGISVDTLYIRCKSDNNMDFSAYCQEKKAEGRELLRAKQYQVAMSGDKTMLIWLGKQYLQQTDKADIQMEGEIKQQSFDLSKLSTETLKELINAGLIGKDSQ